jgi:hypothetical protein
MMMAMMLTMMVVTWQDRYNNDPQADSLSAVQAKIDDVKGIMVENIGTHARHLVPPQGTGG